MIAYLQQCLHAVNIITPPPLPVESRLHFDQLQRLPRSSAMKILRNIWVSFTCTSFVHEALALGGRSTVKEQKNRTVPFQVIGAGKGRTGTTSLHYALEDLGITPVYDWPQYIQPGVDVDSWVQQVRKKKYNRYGPAPGVWNTTEEWDQVIGDYAAIVDAWGSLFFRELLNAYPDAKVVLTVRDSPEAWEKSWNQSIYVREMRRWRSWSFHLMLYLRRLFNWETNRQKMRAAAQLHQGILDKPPFFYQRPNPTTKDFYVDHVEGVRTLIPPDRLLEFNVKQGWQPLCDFLGKEVPNHPFPHVNNRGTFLADKDSNTSKDEQEALVFILGLCATTAALFLGTRYFRKRLRKA